MMSVANGFNSYSINIAMTTVALTTWGHNSFRLSDVLQLNTNRGYKQGAKMWPDLGKPTLLAQNKLQDKAIKLFR